MPYCIYPSEVPTFYRRSSVDKYREEGAMFGTSNDLYSVEAEQCHITPQGLDLLEGSGYEDRDIEELMLSIGGQGLRLYPRTQGVFIILAKDPSGHPEVIPVLDHAFREAAPYYPGGFDRPIPGYAA